MASEGSDGAFQMRVPPLNRRPVRATYRDSVQTKRTAFQARDNFCSLRGTVIWLLCTWEPSDGPITLA